MAIDYSKYPPNWKTEIRPRILERAGNKCEFCGFKNKEIVQSMLGISGERFWLPMGEIIPLHRQYGLKHVKIMLTIAHLDHDETNHDVKDDRLAALCQRCHLRYDTKEKQRRIYEKKHLTQTKLNLI